VLPPDLLARFRQGDDGAFMSVYDEYRGELRPLVARFFASPFEREEATQEIWLHVHRMASAYDPARGPLLPWLRALAVNRCREILRAQGRRPPLDQGLAEGDLVADDTPESRARDERLRAAITRFAASLGAEEAGVFRLALVEELSHDEVAARLGISARRCKYLKLKLLERALAERALRQALEELLDR
jgi:RNA polymerase sigma-70 factor, ECF subfamily